MADPEELKFTSKPVPTGKVDGSAYFVPKPDPDQGYAETQGLFSCDIAMSEPSGLKATPMELPAGKVDGLAYLAPKPDPDQGYAETQGLER